MHLPLPEAQLGKRKVEQPEDIKMDLCSVAEDHTQSNVLAVLRMYDEFGETKRKSSGNVECLVSAYRIRFEQAEEHTGLTDKEERKTMKKRRMKTEKSSIVGLIIYYI